MSKVELQSVKESVGRSKAVGTYQNLYYSDKMLTEFVMDRGNEDIPITAITEEMFEEFRFFLKKREYAASTINRYLCWLSRLMFVFSCFTGMAIADMKNLEYRHIQTAADGQRYIRKERQKIKVEFVMPLHPIAEAIISHCRNEQERNEEQQTVKEKGDSLAFQPHCSRRVMGKNLSIAGKACGIRQRLSYHIARHTFGTMSLNAGIPIESIAKMMGHASISSTQIYAQVTDNKISEDMDRLIAKQSAKDKETMERGF